MSNLTDPPPTNLPPSTKVFSFKNSSIEEVLEDLSSRFILNLPEEELVSVERICFQVEQAHWYYEDYIRDEEPRFPSLPLKTFSRMLFHSCPLLIHWSVDHDQAFQDFMDYKTSVPVCGAIMLNPSWTKCVLVKGWKSSSAWGFPRGKINIDEPEHVCAAREVLEETGYDISDKIIMSAVLKITVRDQRTSLFVVPNVPEDTVFATQTRKEISKIDWFNLTDLPAWKKNTKSPTSHRFYAISSFVGPLKNVMRQLRAEGYTWSADSHSPGRLGDSSMSASHQDAGSNESSISSSSKDEPWPTDPAIVSASRPPDKDHLSRLLGGLSLSNTPASAAATTVRNQVDGALPTPLATPSASAAIKKDIEHAIGIRASSAHTIPSSISIAPPSFASPTPPQSGNSLKSSALPQPLNESKPKFEFISPFDAFVSPTVATKQSLRTSSSQAEGRPRALTVASPTSSSSTEAESSKNRSVSSPTPQHSGFVPEHFVPASVSRAQFASGKRGSLSSQPSSETPSHSAKRPWIAESTSSGPATGSELDSNRRAQHFALLQGVASDIVAKSLPRTHSTGPSHRDDSPFVVRPYAAPERPSIPSRIPISSQPMQTHTSFASFRSTPPATDPRFHNSAPYSPHRSIMSHHSGVFPGAPVPSSYPGAPAPARQPFIGLDTKQTSVPLSPSVSIPVGPPGTPMQRGELLSLLNEGRPHPNTTPLAPFRDPQARRSELPSGTVALGPPVPGLESQESPFVVKPPPPLNRPFPPPFYQPGFPQPRPTLPVSNSHLLSILNQPASYH